MERIREFLNEQLKQIVLSNSRRKEEVSKAKVRPLLFRGSLMFQAEEFKGKQVFHRNMDPEETKRYLKEAMDSDFRQMEVDSYLGTMQVLVSKSGKKTIKVRRNPNPGGRQMPKMAAPEHNRKKQYILKEGQPVPFLEDLGVMTREGKVVRSRYDKFRQINRFLEFVEDILPELPGDREIQILDFGCGKSYLTFAMYYYLNVQKGYEVRITGLDLKEEVIQNCNRLAEKYGFDKLTFLCGDIASYQGAKQVDMVVTLHACDTATDYALAKAVGWNASVILSVPCCQHELNRQIENQLLNPALQYGLIKERMAALYTDAIRAQVLENHGYRTQILEFIDMEHTPKNILIRAVKEGRRAENGTELKTMMEFLHVKNTLADEVGIQ